MASAATSAPLKSRDGNADIPISDRPHILVGGHVALEGTLQDFSLADVFRLIAAGKKTGTLYLEQDSARGRVCFRDGRIFFASSSEAQDSLGRRLVRAHVITDKQLRQALGLQKIQKKEKASRRLGQILVDEGYIDDAVLESFIQEQISDTLFDLFRWEEGSMRFEADDSGAEEDIGISTPVEAVITEAAQRLEQWSKIGVRIPSVDTPFVMAAGPGENLAEIRVKPREWMLLCFMHGGCGIRGLAEDTGYTVFETGRVLHDMLASGLVEARDDVRSAAPEAASEAAEQIDQSSEVVALAG